jgi:ABC-type antimicrobial peptide transport system permease subunit
MKIIYSIFDVVVGLAVFYLLFQIVPTLISQPSDASVAIGVCLLISIIAYIGMKVLELRIEKIFNNKEEK